MIPNAIISHEAGALGKAPSASVGMPKKSQDNSSFADYFSAQSKLEKASGQPDLEQKAEGGLLPEGDSAAEGEEAIQQSDQEKAPDQESKQPAVASNSVNVAEPVAGKAASGEKGLAAVFSGEAQKPGKAQLQPAAAGTSGLPHAEAALSGSAGNPALQTNTIDTAGRGASAPAMPGSAPGASVEVEAETAAPKPDPAAKSAPEQPGEGRKAAKSEAEAAVARDGVRPQPGEEQLLPGKERTGTERASGEGALPQQSSAAAGASARAEYTGGNSAGNGLPETGKQSVATGEAYSGSRKSVEGQERVPVNPNAAPGAETPEAERGQRGGRPAVTPGVANSEISNSASAVQAAGTPGQARAGEAQFRQFGAGLPEGTAAGEARMAGVKGLSEEGAGTETRPASPAAGNASPAAEIARPAAQPSSPEAMRAKQAGSAGQTVLQETAQGVVSGGMSAAEADSETMAAAIKVESDRPVRLADRIYAGSGRRTGTVPSAPQTLQTSAAALQPLLAGGLSIGAGEKELGLLGLETQAGVLGLSAEVPGLNQLLAEASIGSNGVHRPETPRMIAAQMAEAFAAKGNQKVEISLNPQELGRVKMQVSATETGITMVIQAERPETSDLMRRHIHELAEEFRRMGYENISFEFSGGQTGGGGEAGQETGHGAGQSGGTAPGAGADENQTAETQNLRLGNAGVDMRV